jgi:hypothetical protein
MPSSISHNHIETTVGEMQKKLNILQESIEHISKQVLNTSTTTANDIQRLENRCNQRIQQLTNDTQQSIHDIGNTFLTELKLQQQSSNNALQTMLNEREDNLLKRINEQLQTISGTNKNPQTSPTRKNRLYTVLPTK